MNQWVRRMLIKASLKSRTKQEMMPSYPDKFECRGYRVLVDHMKVIASEGIKPAMTEEEAKTVRDSIVNLFEFSYRRYETEVDISKDSFLDSMDTLERANIDFGDQNG